MITEILQGFLPYLPYFVFIALALGVLLVIFLVFLAQKTVAKALKQKTKTRAPQPLQGEHTSFLRRVLTLISTSKDMVSSLGWGRLPKDEMSHSFRQTEEILKTYLGSREPQYELPWYFLIGAEGSGKTTILKDLNLELPIGKPEFEVSEEHSKLIWRFYDGAVILEPNGPFILRENSLSSDNQDWQYLLQLLNRFRPKRPLDGIILTLPCDELLSFKRLSHNEIYERAKVIYTKLWELQSILGIKIPVYVVLTKSDLLPGFQSFIGALPFENSQEIVGWSCPYSADANYSASWVDEAFRYIHRTLDRLRTSIFTARKHNLSLLMACSRFPLNLFNLKKISKST
jgi:type VI secretion system protein ImpL